MSGSHTDQDNEPNHDLPADIDSGLRGKLFAKAGVWDDDIDNVLSLIDTNSISHDSGQFAVLDAIYDHLGKYAASPDTNDPHYYDRRRRDHKQRRNCEFRYRSVSDDGEVQPQGTWVNTVSRVFLDKTHQRSPRCSDEHEPEDVDDRFGMQFRYFDEEKFCIGGLLVDPLITDNPEEAATHLENQLNALPPRIEYLRTLEEIARSTYVMSAGSPVNVSGVGEQTIERLAMAFGAYSNINPYSVSDVSRYLSTNWGNSPDCEKLIEQVREVTEQYEEMYRNDGVEPALDPESLREYPKPQPSKLMLAHRVPHHEL